MPHNSQDRKGPYPLSAHLSMAGSAAALSPQMQSLMPDMIRGIQKYQSYPHAIAPPDLEVFFDETPFRILCATPETKEAAHAVLIVPSLVNRYKIFNLTEEHSFMRWLSNQGCYVYVLDWGDIVDDPKAQNLDDLIEQRLNFAAQKICDHHEGPVHALGYCMGGTLALAGALSAPKLYRSLTCLAAPWDFHAGRAHLKNMIKIWSPPALKSMDAAGKLGVEYVQSLFASLDPTLTAQKFAKFLAMEEGSFQEAVFVAVEDWLNDGVDLPTDIARICIEGWYGQNITMTGEWKVAGATVNPKKLNIPCHVMASDKDNLVDLDSAKALIDLAPSTQMTNPGCGHIGMMAGANCVRDVWAPIFEFMQRA